MKRPRTTPAAIESAREHAREVRVAKGLPAVDPGTAEYERAMASRRGAHVVQWSGVFRGTLGDMRECGWCESCGREVYDGQDRAHRSS